MSVLDRRALEASPLADLHAIASELSIDGYRRLRKANLIDSILAKQEGVEPAADDTGPPEKSAASARGAAAHKDEAATPEDEAAAPEDEAAAPEDEAPAREPESGDDGEERSGSRRRRGRRGGRGRGAAARDERTEDEDHEPERDEPAKRDGGADQAEAADAADADNEPIVEGVVELLANGSGFVRVAPPDPSDDDVYISSAQVKRCELVSGDRITGPKRAPRRSERFASLIRVETINDRPAAELADGVRFDDLPAAFPTERLMVGPDDPTLKAIDRLTPFGKGSRVTICGDPRSGKSHLLKLLAEALAERPELSVQIVLAGVRPEEISEWAQGKIAPVAALSFAASEDSQNSVIEPVIDQARRLAARGTDAVVLIDSLDGSSSQMARKAMASARNIVGGGSLTVIATASAPVGGETTVISLDDQLTSVARFPAIDVFSSGTIHPELLVGADGAEAIAAMRLEASKIADE